MNIILFSIIIPLVFTILLLTIYKKRATWWEIGLINTVSLIVIFGAFSFSDLMCMDTEYWGSLATKAIYYEAWDEYVHRTCEDTDCYGTGKDRTCTTRSYDCSYVDEHPERWELIIPGDTIQISKARYKELVERWGSPKFKDMHRDFYRVDGDAYFVTWDSKEETAEPATTIHTYLNKVQNSSNVINYQQVTKEDAVKNKLFKYPSCSGYYINPIMGIKDSAASKKFDYINGLLGASKQVRLWVLVFINKPIETAMLQEAYWKGGNKNEFVYCIGIDDSKNVKWAHIFSWTKNERLKIESRNFICDMKKLDLLALAEFSKKSISKQFKRREFKEFEYLQINPPTWYIVVSFIIILIANIATFLFVILNSSNPSKSGDNEYSYYRNRSNRHWKN